MRQVLRHQSYRYEHLRSDLNMLVNNRQLFTTVVNVEPFDYDFRFAGHAARPRNLSNGTAEDLGIFLYERGNGQDLQIDFDANPAVHTAQGLADHQRRLIAFIDAVINRRKAVRIFFQNPDLIWRERIYKVGLVCGDENLRRSFLPRGVTAQLASQCIQ